MRLAIIAGLLFCPIASWAAGLPTGEAELEGITVIGTDHDSLVGEADSATEGVVSGSQLEQRPVSRPAELLEFVPGLIATQHSGEGKANQYFLRGFNLDHGTDFYVSVDNLPVNMRTHAHGQGYADLNFLIPELVDVLSYRKGPYYAEIGDFGAAGSADFFYKHHLHGSEVEVTIGEDSFQRVYGATSARVGNGDLLVGGAFQHYDGPFEVEQNSGQFNGLIKYTHGDHVNGFGITAMLYDNDWDSPDQIPLRAVESGLISRLGFIDPTVGGDSHRYSLSADWHMETDLGRWSVDGYALDYGLDLFSNFTYFLNDPVNGDQFEQFDNRKVYGLNAELSMPLNLGGLNSNLTTGIQIRHDDIDDVALFNTANRQRLSTTRNDDVRETSYALFASLNHDWSPTFRSVLGLRVDHLTFEVDSDRPINSGSGNDTTVSPKLSLIFGPFNETEYYFNFGKGFHSNDVRGATTVVDPVDGVTPVEPVDALVDAYSIDLGLRTALAPGLQVAASIWGLNLDSELVFIGDAGGTEASAESRRYGAELAIYYRPIHDLLIDMDYAFSEAEFVGEGAADRIPLSIKHVASLGITWDDHGPFTAGVRLRRVGEAPLIEDNSARSEPTTLLNVDLSYKINRNFQVSLAAFNVLNSRDADVTYFYESRLLGEPLAGVSDIHFHPVQPRNFRVSLNARF